MVNPSALWHMSYMIGVIRKIELSTNSYPWGQIRFNRWLPPILFEQWVDIVNQVYHFEFKNEEDVVKWKWNGKGIYTTKSICDHPTSGDSGRHFQHIWKAKFPCKIKIFTWLMENNAILTKYNMTKRKWGGTQLVFFVTKLKHLIFCSSNVQLLNASGGWLEPVWVQPLSLIVYHNTKSGYKIFYHVGKLYISSALQQYAGLSGRAETKLSLRRS